MDGTIVDPQGIEQRRQAALDSLRQMRAARADLARLRRARRFGPTTGTALVPVRRSVNDLADIAGVGPGLIWALGACAIYSRQMLATADANALRDDLGPVGVILDVNDLQRRAAAPGGAAP